MEPGSLPPWKKDIPKTLQVKWPFPAGPSANYPLRHKIVTSLTMAAVGSMCKLWAEWLNKVTIHNKETLVDLIENREKGRPLVTLFNHHSCIDDPMLWGLLDWKHLVYQNLKYMRWSLAAADICFTKELHARFCSSGRVVPIVRGGGVHQKAIDFMLERLNEGGWVHTFPEGGVNMELEKFWRLKWGIGRLVAESNVTPIVLPIWHYGVLDILPNFTYVPKIGKRATLLVGNPIDFTDMVKDLRNNNSSDVEMRKAITDKIQDDFFLLKQRTEDLYHNVDSKS